MIIGDQRKYLTAVLTIKHEADKDGNIVNKLSPEAIAMLEALGSKAKTAEEARKCPIILKVIQEGIDRANTKAISRAQNVRKWTILDGDFSVDGGELTPTLKLKRNVTAKKYADIIERLYMDSKL